jgi:hypothetical protein
MSLWIALAVGCLVASVLASVISGINGAGGAALFPWALYLSLVVGGGLTLVVAMPVVWFFVRIGYAGPGTVVVVLGTAFFLVTGGPIKVVPREGVLPGLLYVFAVGISYIRFAYKPDARQPTPPT